MPRLRGYRNAHTQNWYDCIRFSQPRDRIALKEGRIVLFGNANIQDPPIFSNLQIGNQLASDQTGVITNWYARTNIPYDTKERAQLVHEFVCASTATLCVGDRPQAVWSLADLWNRRLGDRIGVGNDESRSGEPSDPPEDENEDRVELLARDLHNEAELDMAPERWDTCGDNVKNAFRRAARMALKHLRPPRVWIVPVRQTVSVVINTAPRAVAKLYECMPKDVAPEPCLWIHLDGFSFRDVA